MLYTYATYCNVTGSVDYDSGPYNVTFPAGSTNASFDIIINYDNVLEESEVFVISITSITNGHIVGTPAVATVTIIDITSKYHINYFVYKHKVVADTIDHATRSEELF